MAHRQHQHQHHHHLRQFDQQQLQQSESAIELRIDSIGDESSGPLYHRHHHHYHQHHPGSSLGLAAENRASSWMRLSDSGHDSSGGPSTSPSPPVRGSRSASCSGPDTLLSAGGTSGQRRHDQHGGRMQVPLGPSPLARSETTGSGLLAGFGGSADSGSSSSVGMSMAAASHRLKKLKTPARCRECDSYVYFQGVECSEVRTIERKSFIRFEVRFSYFLRFTEVSLLGN